MKKLILILIAGLAFAMLCQAQNLEIQKGDKVAATIFLKDKVFLVGEITDEWNIK